MMPHTQPYLVNHSQVSYMDIHVFREISDADKELIIQHLKLHNTPFLNRQRWGELFILARDENEAIVGGLIAEQEEDWIFIKYLWVEEQYRHQQLGTQLLHQLEQAAKELKCTHMMVETFSFQAKPFYERQGFSVRMTLEDCPSKGTHCHYLTRNIAEVSG